MEENYMNVVLSLIGLVDVLALIFNEHLFDEKMDSSVKCELSILLGVSIWTMISYLLEIIR